MVSPGPSDQEELDDWMIVWIGDNKEFQDPWLSSNSMAQYQSPIHEKQNEALETSRGSFWALQAIFMATQIDVRVWQKAGGRFLGLHRTILPSKLDSNNWFNC